MGIANEILEEELAQKSQPDYLQAGHIETGIANKIIGEDVQRHFEPTQQQSAITAKPIEKFTGKGGEGASYWTHVKQGFVDDPFTKVKIYAADRFPELSEDERLDRYSTTKKGEVIYKADDGKWYSEAPDLFPFKLKKFFGETTANAPAIALGTAGEFTGGIPGAVAGAAAGESIRKNIGTYAFGEKTTMGQYLKDVAVEGALGGAGSIPARGGIKVARKVGGAFGGRTGMRVTKALGSELPHVNFKAARKLQKQVKEDFGVDLFDAQTTESRRLLDRLNLYGDLPETSDMVQIAKTIQDEQAFKAADDYFNALYDPDPEFISAAAVKMNDDKIIHSADNPRMHHGAFDEIPMDQRANILDDQGFVTNRGRWLTRREASDVIGSPELADASEGVIGAIIPGTDPLYAGQKITDAAKKSIDRELKARVAKAKPLYDKAFKAQTQIDIEPHIDDLNEKILLAPKGSPRKKALTRYKKMLMRDKPIIVEEQVPIKTDQFGRTHYKTVRKKTTTEVPESRIKNLDELKKATDEYLDSFRDAPIGNRTKKDIRTIKNNILQDLDDANSTYKKARQTWADDSEAIKRLTHKTRLQGVAGLEGDHVENAANMLFNNLKDSPALVKRARARIMREDPEAWDAALRGHVQSIYDSTSKTTGGGAADAAKVFGNFYRKTIGNKKQSDILEAAMGPEKFKNFESLVDTLRRVALVVKKESQTAPRQAMMKEDIGGSGFVSRQIAARFKPLVTHRRLAWEKLMDLQTSRNRKKMAEAMLDPRASQHLLKIKRMGVNTEKGLRAFSTFASLVIGGEFRRHGSDLYESYQEYKQMNELQSQH